MISEREREREREGGGGGGAKRGRDSGRVEVRDGVAGCPRLTVEFFN